MKRISFGSFAISDLQVYQQEANGFYLLQVRAQVKDVNDPEKVSYISNDTQIPKSIVDAEWMEQGIFDLAMDLIRHELEEWFTVDGAHIRDPHKKPTWAERLSAAQRDIEDAGVLGQLQRGE